MPFVNQQDLDKFNSEDILKAVNKECSYLKRMGHSGNYNYCCITTNNSPTCVYCGDRDYNHRIYKE